MGFGKTCGWMLGLLALILIFPFTGAAAEKDLSVCAAIQNDAERLACFDRLAGILPPPVDENAQVEPPPTEAPVYDTFLNAAESEADTYTSPLGRAWELDASRKGGIFRFRFHKPIYLFPVRYTDRPNRYPSTPNSKTSVEEKMPMDYNEVMFQLSFKTKLWENFYRGNGDLWFGYTQQSHWQLYNSDVSSPFRETNYEPELIFTWRTDVDLFGVNWRLVNLGLVHQSNGRSEPLSRSWNRVYAQFGFEKDTFVLLARPWLRIEESRKNDDNPDMEDYTGNGDIVMHYKVNENLFSLLARYSFEGNKGGAQFDWAFPIYRNLKGNFHLFSGYGENLLDYNHYQNVIGLGVSLANWQ